MVSYNPHDFLEPAVACANCGRERPVGDMEYDEEMEHFVCDRDCFHEWADANFERVAEYYYERNIGY